MSQTKEQWMAWVWPGIHWYQGIAPFWAYVEDMPKLGYKFSKLAATYSKGTEAYYFVQNEYEENGRKFFLKVKENPYLLLRYLKKVDQTADQIFKLGLKWQQTDFSKLSNKQLLACHQQLFKLDSPLWRNGQIQNLLELHNSLLSDYVKKLLHEKFGKKASECFNIFTTSRYHSVTEQQEESFLKLVKNPSAIKLRGHFLKYTWMTCGWAGPAISLEEFKQNIAATKRKQSIAKKILQNIQGKNKILAQQDVLLKQLPKYDAVLVILLRKILEAKAKRVDAHSLTYFLADKMNVEIGRRVGLSVNQLRVVEPFEVPKLFKHTNPDKLNQEYARVMYWFEKGKQKKYTGKQAEQKLAYITARLPKVKKVKQFSGELAYPGKVRGKVCILLDIQDKNKFKPGQILVTRMTDPSYIPLMKQAKAILTDIGGITCHAAIVSRELKKPCLVGTKFATEILKDGDFVEVDANKGIVKKL